MGPPLGAAPDVAGAGVPVAGVGAPVTGAPVPATGVGVTGVDVTGLGVTGAGVPVAGSAEVTGAVWRTRSASGTRCVGAATWAGPGATVSKMDAATSAGRSRPWSPSSAASPPSYPWPMARTFQAPWRRYSSRAMTADSLSSPVIV